MSVNDPIADMLTRIRNGMMRRPAAGSHAELQYQSGNCPDLQRGRLYREFRSGLKAKSRTSKVLRLNLKYVGERRERQPVITGLVRVSRPGRRVYTRKQDIPWVLSGMGIAILSTPKGVMTGQRPASWVLAARSSARSGNPEKEVIPCLELDVYP